MRTRIRKRICLMVALLSLLWGCRDLLVELQHHGEPGSAGVADGGVPVSIVLENIESSVSRTIAPSHLTQAELSSNTYRVELTGTSNMGPSINIQNFSLVNGVGGVALSVGTWTLKLTVYIVATNTPLLTGSASITVAGDPSSALFTLAPVTTGNGSFRVNITWTADDRDLVFSGWRENGRRYELGLYNSITGEPTRFVRDWTYNAGDNNGTPAVNFDWDRQDIPAGKYIFKYTISGGGLPEDTILCWQDTVYIEPGRESFAAINIPKMAHVPAVPTNFVENCTEFTGNGAYTATLSWGTSFTATSYELEVMRYVTGTPRPTDDTTWTNAGNAQTSSVFTYTAETGSPDNYTNPNHDGFATMKHVSGGLQGAHESIVYRMKMTSGEGFAARIRAVNSYGKSNWVYLASPMVPERPYFPTSFSGEAGLMQAGDKFTADFKWQRGIVDANGTYELELLAFTGGTKPMDEATWNAAQGSVTYSHRTGFASAGSPASLVPGVGGLGYGDESVQLEITGTNAYYTARLRAVNSGGGASDWLYIQNVLIPTPVYASAAPTRASYNVWDASQGKSVPVWDVTMGIHGPRLATQYNTSWLRLTQGSFGEALDNDARYDQLMALPANRGSGTRAVTAGSTSNTWRQMNNGSPFLFRIRVETPYGNSPWWYWPQEVRQQP